MNWNCLSRPQPVDRPLWGWGSDKAISETKESSKAPYAHSYSLYVRWLTTSTTLSTLLSVPRTDTGKLLIIWEPIFFQYYFFLTKNKPHFIPCWRIWIASERHPSKCFISNVLFFSPCLPVDKCSHTLCPWFSQRLKKDLLASCSLDYPVPFWKWIQRLLFSTDHGSLQSPLPFNNNWEKSCKNIVCSLQTVPWRCIISDLCSKTWLNYHPLVTLLLSVSCLWLQLGDLASKSSSKEGNEYFMLSCAYWH